MEKATNEIEKLKREIEFLNQDKMVLNARIISSENVIEQQKTKINLLENKIKSFTKERSSSINSSKSVIPHNFVPMINGDNLPISYEPSQIRRAYGLDEISLPEGTLPGEGIKVAVVIAYHYENLQKDFDKFCTMYSFPKSKLTVINHAGNKRNNTWALEECLDVQMVKLAAPGATIIVVEALNNSYSSLSKAILAAVANGADIISMSWGSSEFSTQLTTDLIFSNKRVCYLASSGDYSSEVCYPSSSSNVLSVGGTSLYLNEDNTRHSETVWGSAGGGVSDYFHKPSYQSNFNSSYNKRTVPDISMISNPNTGVNVICSLFSRSPISLGGTSVACPLMAGYLAIVNQLRVSKNKEKLTTVFSSNYHNVLQQFLYNICNTDSYSENIYDIISGDNGNFQGAEGYDIISGVGSIHGNSLCNSLANF